MEVKINYEQTVQSIDIPLHHCTQQIDYLASNMIRKLLQADNALEYMLVILQYRSF